MQEKLGIECWAAREREPVSSTLVGAAIHSSGFPSNRNHLFEVGRGFRTGWCLCQNKTDQPKFLHKVRRRSLHHWQVQNERTWRSPGHAEVAVPHGTGSFGLHPVADWERPELIAL